MTHSISGLHHVTAISGDAQENLDFYADFLGLRFVKRTVNFDDPGTYHLYYGDETGQPGTIMTFFPWANAAPGREGVGMTSATQFGIPTSAFDFWMDRFARRGVDFAAPQSRFDEQVLAFRDPHGLPLELVAHPDSDALPAWREGPVPAEQAITGFHGVTLWVADPGPTAELLTETFGYRRVGTEDDRTRFHAANEGDPGLIVDLYHPAEGPHARPGVGTTHHVAFRAQDDAHHKRWRQSIAEQGYNVTPQIDRQYFHSIYFREPNGVLFEIATDAPGFLYDEPVESLGTSLKLPPQYEPRRADLEEILPPLRLPAFS